MLMTVPELKSARVYGDGSVFNNGRENASGGYGFHIEIGGVMTHVGGGYVPPKCTNNISEMMAVITPLRLLRSRPDLDVISFISDSRYVVDGMNSWASGWERRDWRNAEGQPVKNRDLWEKILQYKRTMNISAKWVKGHAGDHLNEVVDSIAHYCNKNQIAFLMDVTPANHDQVQSMLLGISSAPSTKRAAPTARLIDTFNKF